MSAGTGVQHSEFNHQPDGATHFLQIWIEPARRGIAPGYEEKHFAPADKRGRLRLIASPDGAEGSVLIHQDAQVYAALIDGEESVRHAVPAGRRVYVHVARGELAVNGQRLVAGDAAKLVGEPALDLDRGRQAEVLVFDLA
jgi:redox-sensitive bicupin YhaK (pirin superfamily)